GQRSALRLRGQLPGNGTYRVGGSHRLLVADHLHIVQLDGAVVEFQKESLVFLKQYVPDERVKSHAGDGKCIALSSAKRREPELPVSIRKRLQTARFYGKGDTRQRETGIAVDHLAAQPAAAYRRLAQQPCGHGSNN